MSKYDSRTAEKVVIRMPEGLRGKIKAVAAENRRSMNNLIVRMLEAQLEPSPTQQEKTWIPQIGQSVQPRYITEDWGAGEFGTIIGFVLENGILKAEVKHVVASKGTELISLELIRPVQITL